MLGDSLLEIKVSSRVIEQLNTLNINRIKTLTKHFCVASGGMAMANWPVQSRFSPLLGYGIL